MSGLAAVQIGTALLVNCLQFEMLTASTVNVEVVICCETDNYLVVSVE